ncbi:ORF6N domain-containing protein [Ancylobacter sp.]|uniref:ORF6N domain-containing protein n=1 Tax=Ancylobacter sp. TaxID=1872567 RepID=UPI003D0E4D84
MTTKEYNKSQKISIAGTDVQRVLYQDEPVVTFAMVDAIHQRPEGTAGRTFRENRARFVEGEDYVDLTSDEIRRMSETGTFPPRSSRGTLITRRGYLKLVKPLTDDRAWDVQGEMIDRYFAVEKLAALAPDVLEMIRRDDGISRMLARKVTALEGRIDNLLVSVNARVAALEYVSVRELLEEAKAIQKGRRGLNRKVGHELKNRALLAGHPAPCRRCPHSGVWLFQRDFASLYMKESGAALVADHNARQRGQGNLFVIPAKGGEARV